MNISIIVATGQRGEIGKDNKIPWHISGDLKRFRRLTTGHTIIMGRKTWFSLPKRPLPGRKNIVLTRSKTKNGFEGAIVCRNLQEVLNHLDKDEENFIIGGSTIYEIFLPFAGTLYLTVVHKSYEADVFFPELNKKDWELLEEKTFCENNLAYTNYIYKKRNIMLQMK